MLSSVLDSGLASRSPNAVRPLSRIRGLLEHQPLLTGMAGIVKAVFGSPQSESPLSRKSQSFNDLSVGAHEDLQVRHQLLGAVCRLQPCNQPKTQGLLCAGRL